MKCACQKSLKLFGLQWQSSRTPHSLQQARQQVRSMAQKRLDAHLHVWASKQDAEAGKFPFVVCPARAASRCVCKCAYEIQLLNAVYCLHRHAQCGMQGAMLGGGDAKAEPPMPGALSSSIHAQLRRYHVARRTCNVCRD